MFKERDREVSKEEEDNGFGTTLLVLLVVEETSTIFAGALNHVSRIKSLALVFNLSSTGSGAAWAGLTGNLSLAPTVL